MALHRHPPAIAFSIACLGIMLLIIPNRYRLKVLDGEIEAMFDAIARTVTLGAFVARSRPRSRCVVGLPQRRCGKICDACVTSRRGTAELLRFTLAGHFCDIWCRPVRTKVSIFLGSTTFAPCIASALD